MLDKIMRSIREVKDVDTMIFLLKDLCDEAHRIIDRNTMSVQEAEYLRSCTQEIRALLQELELINKTRNNDRRARSLAFIDGCFDALEDRTEAIIKLSHGN